MASAPIKGAVAEPSKLGDLAAVPYATASTVAWLCAVPCALVVLVAMLVLGPPFGRLVAPGDAALRYLPVYRQWVHPEPTEQGRFLIALSAPLLLSLATTLVMRRRPRLPMRVQTAGVAIAQVALAALLAACFAMQAHTRYGPEYLGANTEIGWSYFTVTTFLVASAAAIAAAFALGGDRARAVVHGLRRESPARRAAAVSAAVALTAIWLLHAINTDHSIANAPLMVTFHLAFPLDEAFAVLNGLTPLVDFSAQYGSLLPWVSALSMLAFGKSLIVFTITMCTLTALALLAVYDILRRVTRSALVALALYLPLLATSLFRVSGTSLERETFGTYFGMFPLRYAGPYLLAWLTTRQIEQRGGRAGTWPLFLVAGLVLLNNLEFGIAALGASLAAFLWTSSLNRRTLLRLGVATAAGLAVALALVSLFTLARAGSLPRLWRLTDYAQLYTQGSFSMLPIRAPLGVHIVIYLTYVAAIATATVRAVRTAPNRVLTGMLAWSGVFGLGIGSYFVGRSHPEALIATFSAWGLALALLTIVAVARLTSVRARRPSLAAVIVLFGFGIMVCSLAQTPAPWSQLRRLNAPFNPEPYASGATQPLQPVQRPATKRFVSSIADGPSHFVVRRGAPVAILTPMGHRTADAYGIVDVAPYTGHDSMETEERVEATIDALQAAGGNTVIVPVDVDARVIVVLDRRGFAALTASGHLARYNPNGRNERARLVAWQNRLLMKWVDLHHLHPRALE